MQVATDEVMDKHYADDTLPARNVDKLTEFASVLAARKKTKAHQTLNVSARKAPLCRVLLAFLLVYAVFLIFSCVFNSLAANSCGLGPLRHELRLKNETTEINGAGVSPGVYRNSDATSDEIGVFAQRVTRKVDKLVIERMPVGVILNSTLGKRVMSNITFGSASTGGLAAAGGAKTNFNVLTPDRRHVSVPRAFFNAGHYLRDIAQLDVERCDSEFLVGVHAGGSYCTYGPDDPRSVIPFWLLDFTELSGAAAACALDFELEIQQQANFHVFEPMIVRDYAGKIYFRDAEFAGQLIVQNGNKPLEVVLERSKVNRIVLTQSTVTVQMDSTSLLHIERPQITEDDSVLTYYGVAAIALDSSLVDYKARVRVWDNTRLVVNGAEVCAGISGRALVSCSDDACKCLEM